MTSKADRFRPASGDLDDALAAQALKDAMQAPTIALRDADRSLELNPRNCQAFCAKAYAHEVMQNTQQAIECMERALEFAESEAAQQHCRQELQRLAKARLRSRLSVVVPRRATRTVRRLRSLTVEGGRHGDRDWISAPRRGVTLSPPRISPARAAPSKSLDDEECGEHVAGDVEEVLACAHSRAHRKAAELRPWAEWLVEESRWICDGVARVTLRTNVPACPHVAEDDDEAQKRLGWHVDLFCTDTAHEMPRRSYTPLTSMKELREGYMELAVVADGSDRAVAMLARAPKGVRVQVCAPQCTFQREKKAAAAIVVVDATAQSVGMQLCRQLVGMGTLCRFVLCASCAASCIPFQDDLTRLLRAQPLLSAAIVLRKYPLPLWSDGIIDWLSGPLGQQAFASSPRHAEVFLAGPTEFCESAASALARVGRLPGSDTVWTIRGDLPTPVHLMNCRLPTKRPTVVPTLELDCVSLKLEETSPDLSPGDQSTASSSRLKYQMKNPARTRSCFLSGSTASGISTPAKTQSSFASASTASGISTPDGRIRETSPACMSRAESDPMYEDDLPHFPAVKDNTPLGATPWSGFFLSREKEKVTRTEWKRGPSLFCHCPSQRALCAFEDSDEMRPIAQPAQEAECGTTWST